MNAARCARSKKGGKKENPSDVSLPIFIPIPEDILLDSGPHLNRTPRLPE